MPHHDRALIAATMAAFSGFILGMGFYVLLELAFLWGPMP